MRGRSRSSSPATHENALNEKRRQSASSALHLPIIDSVDFLPSVFDSLKTLRGNAAVICCSFPPRLEVLLSSLPLPLLSFAAPSLSTFPRRNTSRTQMARFCAPILLPPPALYSRVSSSLRAKLKMIAVGLPGLPLCFQCSSVSYMTNLR